MRQNPRYVQFEYIAQLTPARKNQSIQIWLAIPVSTVQQDIAFYRATPEPKFIYGDRHGNQITYNKLTGSASLSLKVNTRLWQNEAAIKNKEEYALPVVEYKKYTKSEKYIEQTSEVIRLARKLTKDSASLPAALYDLTEWIKHNFTYRHPVLHRGVRNLRLNKPSGDCGEAGALFVALCRSLGIPAVNRTGFIMYHDESGKMYEHGWMSVFTKAIGWIDIDPRAHNIFKRGSSYRYVQKNHFLNFSTGFSLPLRPPVSANGDLSFWRDLGLPCTRKSVQVLQPVFFCSSGKVSFRERLKIREKEEPRSAIADRGK
jgi:hypothetical protein